MTAQQVMEIVFGLGFFVFCVGLYKKAPGMWDRYLDVNLRIAEMHASEKERDRQHQIAAAESDAKMRHADRNILMVGQSELVGNIMADHREDLKIICGSLCKYPRASDWESTEEPDRPREPDTRITL